MPYYTTKSRDHYHLKYGCHGATIVCGTEGMEPCSFCVDPSRRRKATGAAGTTAGGAGSSAAGSSGEGGYENPNTSLADELTEMYVDSIDDEEKSAFLREVVFAVGGVPITQGELEEVLLWAVDMAEGGDGRYANESDAPRALDDELMEGLFAERFDWLGAPASLRSQSAPSSEPSPKEKAKRERDADAVPVDEESLPPREVHVDLQSLEESANPEIIEYIARKDVIGHPLFTKAMKQRNKQERGYIGAEIERRCGGQNDDLPHADLVSEHGTYEIKSNTDPNGNMSMFDKVPSDSYVREGRQGKVSPSVMRNRRICELFGGPSQSHPGMISYASPNAPTYLGQTSQAGQTIKVDEDGVYITYDHSKDRREPCPVPEELRHGEVEIFRWSREELEQHIEDKFGQDGTLSFHPSKKGDPYCDCMDVLRPFDYDEFIGYLERGLVKFDAGIRTDVPSAPEARKGEGRMHFMWRFTAEGRNAICIESWKCDEDGTFRKKGRHRRRK